MATLAVARRQNLRGEVRRGAEVLARRHPLAASTAFVAIVFAGAAPEAKPEPKVSIRASIKPDYIVCLEDGKKQKMLKRHLMTNHGMTPDEYRQKWGLGADYPMVAPNYAEQRRTLAKSIGLGTKRRKTARGRKA